MLIDCQMDKCVMYSHNEMLYRNHNKLPLYTVTWKNVPNKKQNGRQIQGSTCYMALFILISKTELIDKIRSPNRDHSWGW